MRGRKAKRAVAGVTAMAWHGNDGDVLSADECLLLRMRRRRRECMDGLCNALRRRLASEPGPQGTLEFARSSDYAATREFTTEQRERAPSDAF